MLIIAKSFKELSFSKLMEVYLEGNLENGNELWPELSEGEQLIYAEQEFYQYLTKVFFPTHQAVYAIWEEKGKYVSALRLEPFKDGLLIEALETAPEERQKGYAGYRRGRGEGKGLLAFGTGRKESENRKNY